MIMGGIKDQILELGKRFYRCPAESFHGSHTIISSHGILFWPAPQCASDAVFGRSKQCLYALT